ncbi:MAG: AbrB/MazE/SpoVT family DNA-binding domain-containing protein [Methyloprofundus sp.]|nr:AbrB/MazE/SpoVT family DNA-binding domain-containing protein [Methyloprofundus sp.]MDT8426949.1 AbrB/MazE/SpoVT family DNA-binding domain-containing protein [Methyloprofundus sp.]
MQSQINKWGNSTAVRIPASILSGMGLSVNSHITIEVKDGKIIIEPIKPLQKNLKLPFTEEALLQNLNAYTAHADKLATPISVELGD